MDTTKAVDKKFFNRNGEDFIQYVDRYGNIVSGVVGDGTYWSADFVTSGGVSLNALKTRVDNIGSTNLPNQIDIGTF